MSFSARTHRRAESLRAMRRHTAAHTLLRRAQHVGALLAASLLLCLAFGLASRAGAQANVVTQHNDSARTGQNLSESVLTPSNVNINTFGKLFSLSVDGYVYAQPLYVSALPIQGAIHNVVFVATEHDSVYAFDADSNTGANANPLWHTSFLNSTSTTTVTTVPNPDTGSWDIVPEIGITGTPVIDLSTNTLYVVAKTKEVTNSTGAVSYVQRLHALNITTGAEKTNFNSPVVISASVAGTGDGSVNGVVTFDPLRQHNRPGLLLLNGVVYLGFASHGDNTPYHGWVLGYNAQTLQQVVVYNATPNGKTDPSGYPIGAGGIWMAGSGLASDGSSIFFMVGNGTFESTLDGNGFPNQQDYGDSFVKLNANGTVSDYFTPYNELSLDDADADLGSGGNLVLPNEAGSTAHPHLLVGAGKEGSIYLIDRDNMGHFNSSNDNQIVQELANTIGGTWSMPAYFNDGTTKWVYYQGVGDALKAFSIANAQLSTTPVYQSSDYVGYPSPSPSVSANGKSNGIVWTIQSDGYYNSSPAILHAHSASNVSTELYNSAMEGDRDQAGGAVKFAVPTVANGKVYVGAEYEVDVYGNGQFEPTPTISPNGGASTSPITVTLSDSDPNASIFYTTDGSEPTTSSPLYTNPFLVSTCATVKAKAFRSGYHPSGSAVAQFLVGPGPGNGDGLWATYYNNLNLSGTHVNRIDSTVNFNWNGNPPAISIPGVNWSATWTGKVKARCTGTYTFYTISDDGVRLWVNSAEIINDWTYHAPTVDYGTINLVAGKSYTIKAEYFQGGGGSVMQLYWSNAGEGVEIIPQSQLSSGHVATPVIAPTGGNFYPSVTVSMSDVTPGAILTYTTDGTTPTASSTPYNGPFTVSATTTVKARAFKNALTPSLTTKAVFTLNPNLSNQFFAINSGGSTAGSFVADEDYSGGTPSAFGGTVDTSLVTDPAPQAVYQTERYGNFSYALPGLKPKVTYLVRLHFAELYWNSPGQRIFNVTINGKQVLSDFDIVAATGSSYKAIVEEFRVVSDSTGTINITFTSVVDNAKVSGIEVVTP
ncbi:MAG TPA: chitobiase/beta-hexosaminidase C-terminal domain-containing protein [Chthonomonadaceae bacterium]|nr:chitobiase/beta-hexosaminidase C-terminal domain-containing protein [Chthonomonadaceae bacterium]